MTPCAIRDCLNDATAQVTRDGIARPACAPHAAQAAEAGYQVVKLPREEIAVALERARQAAQERELAEHRFRHAMRHARAAGASYGQLATASGLSRWGARYITLTDDERRADNAARKEKP